MLATLLKQKPPNKATNTPQHIITPQNNSKQTIQTTKKLTKYTNIAIAPSKQPKSISNISTTIQTKIHKSTKQQITT